MLVGRLRVDASFDVRDGSATRPAERLAALSAFFAAALIALVSLVGILDPTTYARETRNWAAQAIGQDWVDLLFAVPWLVISGAGALRGSRRALFVLTGGLFNALYLLVIYAFAVHFNALFLVYCAGLGVSLFGLLAAGAALSDENAPTWFPDSSPVRTPAILLIAVGLGFAALWLSEVVPALARGATPASVTEAGVPTNPVQVRDLSVVLPAHVATGMLLLRRHPFGYLAAPVLLSFGVLMALSIAGMMVVMRARHIDVNLGVAAAMGALSVGTAAVLLALLRRVR